jgi:hypothetical protein
MNWKRLVCRLLGHKWVPRLTGSLAVFGPDDCTRCGDERGVPIILDSEPTGFNRIYLLDAEKLAIKRFRRDDQQAAEGAAYWVEGEE